MRNLVQCLIKAWELAKIVPILQNFESVIYRKPQNVHRYQSIDQRWRPYYTCRGSCNRHDCVTFINCHIGLATVPYSTAWFICVWIPDVEISPLKTYWPRSHGRGHSTHYDDAFPYSVPFVHKVGIQMVDSNEQHWMTHIHASNLY